MVVSQRRRRATKDVLTNEKLAVVMDTRARINETIRIIAVTGIHENEIA